MAQLLAAARGCVAFGDGQKRRGRSERINQGQERNHGPKIIPRNGAWKWDSRLEAGSRRPRAIQFTIDRMNSPHFDGTFRNWDGVALHAGGVVRVAHE